MLNSIKNYFHKKREQRISRIAHATSQNVIHYLLASISLEKLERLIEQGKINRNQTGHTNYTNLAELYIKLLSEH